MNRLLLTAFFSLLATTAWSSDFSCRVTKGIYMPPGEDRLVDASARDPSIIGRTFSVDRKTGRVVGGGLLSNSSEEIKVLRNVNEIINVFEVQSMNAHSDVKLLNVAEHEKKITFRYYFGWLGLLLTGECNRT